ncbi:MAG: putative peptidoglycan glycosyltransferase FtsW [Bacteroidota bacterium]|nr:putative peptidoglycan glycosyltransferase FtsW [Bacteroidota bacterium]
MTETFRKYFKGDAVIWAVIISLCILSILAVYSATGTLAYKAQNGNTAFYILRHISFLFIGLVIMFVTQNIPYRYYSRLSAVFFLVSIPLLLATLVFGRHLNDASRWLTIPGLGIPFQTSDFAKLALMMYVARTLSLKQDNIKNFKEAFIPLIIPVAIICLLILPANFSTAAILFTASIVLMFVGRVSVKHIFALFAVGFLLVALFIGVALLLHKQGRIETWKNRIENFASGEDSFQVEQGKIAIATGGIIGKGPGNSTQRNFLPHPYSDFIYAIVIEEYGLVGGVVVLFFYLWLLFRAGIIVRKSERTFPAFLAIGLTLILMFQAMVNMAVAVNLFPVTGQTLPLVSMGGTSMLFTCFSLGIILSVSNGTQALEPLIPEDKTTNTDEQTSDIDEDEEQEN